MGNTIEIQGQTYTVERTGLTFVAYTLIGERGGKVSLIKRPGDTTGNMIALDARNRRQFGRTVFTDKNGRVEVAPVVTA